MKIVGVIVALIGGTLFGWHIAKVFIGTDIGTTHQIMSLVGGVTILVGIALYSIGKKRGVISSK